MSKMKTLFEDRRLTGYEIAINDELSSIVRRDSTDFAAEYDILLTKVDKSRTGQAYSLRVDRCRPQAQVTDKLLGKEE